MSERHCVVFGTGRVAGGFLAPLLRSAGWDVLLVGRERRVVSAIAETGGVWLHTTAARAPRRVDG
ncbi:MAG: hypothetical protein ACRDIB_12575, partial [Ardenticatenaceae bacterium]